MVMWWGLGTLGSRTHCPNSWLRLNGRNNRATHTCEVQNIDFGQQWYSSNINFSRSKLRSSTDMQYVRFQASAVKYKNCALLGYYAAISGKFLTTFRDNFLTTFRDKLSVMIMNMGTQASTPPLDVRTFTLKQKHYNAAVSTVICVRQLLTDSLPGGGPPWL
jgi:hypothetical protein